MSETASGLFVIVPSLLLSLVAVATLVLQRRDKGADTRTKDLNRRRRADLKFRRIYDDYIDLFQGAQAVKECLEAGQLEVAKALLLQLTRRNLWPDPMEELYSNDANGNGNGNGNGKH